MSLAVEVSVQPPDLAAAACLVGAVVAIDLAALRWGRATISRFMRHIIWEHPVAAATVAAALAAHLVFEIEGDPARWVAGRWAAGMAARQTGGRTDEA